MRAESGQQGPSVGRGAFQLHHALEREGREGTDEIESIERVSPFTHIKLMA